jgi:hypothetical protein
MTAWFRDLPIRRKLAVLMVVSGIIVVVLSSAALWVFKTFDLRETAAAEISTLAETMGSNTTAALTFQDRRAAEETLTALRADQRILLAAVFDKDGSLFARYVRRGASPGSAGLRPVGQSFEGDTLLLVRPIVLDTETIGFIHSGSLKPVQRLRALEAQCRRDRARHLHLVPSRSARHGKLAAGHRRPSARSGRDRAAGFGGQEL